MNNFSRRKFLLGSLSAPIAVAGASFVSGCSKKQSDAPHGIGIESVHEKLKHDRFEYEIGVVDSHTEGEFCRIAFDGFPEPKGNSVMEKKKYMQENYDNLRKALMLEPRGHRNMFGAFLCKPNDSKADMGVIFMDTGGYLNMCGHCSIGTVTALFETGYLDMNNGENKAVIETPSGIIEATANIQDNKVEDVTIQNVPAFVYKENLTIDVDGKTIPYDICFGGSFFALVDSEKLGIKELTVEHSRELITLGMDMKEKINQTVKVQHPSLDINTVDLVEFYGPTSDKDKADLRNIVVFGDSQIDRSPCGTGTSAKLSLLYKKGILKKGQDFRYESVLGSVFIGRVIDTTKVGDYDAVIPTITGSAYLTGYGKYLVDPKDPLRYGFNLNT